MLKSKDVIGKPVLSHHDGKKIESVKDLIVGKDNSRIVALLIDEGGLFSKAVVVPMEKVVSVGEDVVVITDSNAPVPARDYPPAKESLDQHGKLMGKQVFTEGGDEFSEVSDLYFDEKTGHITGFELAGGKLEEASKSPAYLPIEDVVSVGPDAVLVKTEAASRLVAQPGSTEIYGLADDREDVPLDKRETV